MGTASDQTVTYANAYRVDLREFRFLLWEQFKVQDEILAHEHFGEFTREITDDLLDAARNFAYERLGPNYQTADRQGCKLNADGSVSLPLEYGVLWREFRDAQWGSLGAPPHRGGLGAPYVVSQMVNEIFMGADPSFMTYSGFCVPALALIERFGSKELQDTFCEKLADNTYSACLVMTEPQAGSDIGNLRTKATKQEDGSYLIEGGKIFISAGMHDLAENIVYIVLARPEGCPPGTVGLSCFIVPRFHVNADGSRGASNNVECIRLEEKMGIHGCATAQLSFGENGPTVGYLLGDREKVGLRQLLTMMNQARITTGIYALGMASSAYLNALEYAHNRFQGTDFRQSFNPNAPKVPIIAHADVRRMLLEMKSKTEGCRALIVKLALHQTHAFYYADKKRRSEGQLPEDEEAALVRHQGLVNLLTPIVKAYVSDQAWRVAELAIQTYGGYGYIQDYPVEQYARDVKIMAVWEGTNFVQSADLIRDKLALGRGSRLFELYRTEVGGFAEELAQNADFAAEAAALKEALQVLTETQAIFGRWVKEQKIEMIFTVSTRFLEMMSEVTLAWLLLDGARRAGAALPQANESDRTFYEGKIAGARFFVRNVLPGVECKARIIRSEDDTVLRTGPEILRPAD